MCSNSCSYPCLNHFQTLFLAIFFAAVCGDVLHADALEFYCSNFGGSGGHIRYATEYYFVTLEFAGVAVAVFFVVRLMGCSTKFYCVNLVILCDLAFCVCTALLILVSVLNTPSFLYRALLSSSSFYLLCAASSQTMTMTLTVLLRCVVEGARQVRTTSEDNIL